MILLKKVLWLPWCLWLDVSGWAVFCHVRPIYQNKVIGYIAHMYWSLTNKASLSIWPWLPFCDTVMREPPWQELSWVLSPETGGHFVALRILTPRPRYLCSNQLMEILHVIIYLDKGYLNKGYLFPWSTRHTLLYRGIRCQGDSAASCEWPYCLLGNKGHWVRYPP